jgi:hypothetical protein
MEFLPESNTIITLVVIAAIFFILFKVFKMLLSLLWVVAFFVIAYLTNPQYPAHEKALMEKAANLGKKISGKYMEVDDYKVVSFTKIGEERKMVGIGAFTQVWIFGSL